jgi:hypothetical protein
MRQALHILKKDASYLWREIIVYTFACALFVQTTDVGKGPAQTLLILASAYLIARAFQAEAIPGQNQFWLTRPYKRSSLLVAKLLFVLIFVNLPVLFARLAIVSREHFPIGASIPGLLLSQAVLIICVWLPIAAVSALTTRMTHMVVIAMVVQVLLVMTQNQILYSGLYWPFGVQWIRDSLALLLIVAAAAIVLKNQYGKRQTLHSAVVAIAAVLAIVVVYTALPAGFAMSVQSRLSTKPFNASALTVSVEQGQRISPRTQLGNQVQVPLLFAVSGLPQEGAVHADAMELTFEMPGGTTWKSGLKAVSGRTDDEPSGTFQSIFYLDQATYEQLHKEAVILHGSLYLTAFGSPQSTMISAKGKPVNLGQGMQCNIDDMGRIACRSAFRFPNQLLMVKDREVIRPVLDVTSYSPIPSASVYPIVSNFYYSPLGTLFRATLIAEQPLSHFRRDFEVQNFKLQ